MQLSGPPSMFLFRYILASSSGSGVQFAEDFEELVDLEEFLEYEDQLHLEV